MTAVQRQNTGRSASFADTPFRSVAAGVNPILVTDLYLLIDATLGNVTLPLPSAVGLVPGKGFWLLRTDSTVNTVTLAPVGGQTINGGASATINAQFQSLYVVTDGANWFLYASPGSFSISADILWVFPGQIANDQSGNIFTYIARKPITFIGFDVNFINGGAPTGSSVIIDWAVNGIINPNFQVIVAAGMTYGETLFPAKLATNDLLNPVVTQPGSSTPGTTMVMRARGS